MAIPSKKGRPTSLTPAKLTSRQLDALELELRRVGRACAFGEHEPDRCSVFDEAADQLQHLGRRVSPAPTPESPPSAPAVSPETKKVEVKAEVEAPGRPPEPTYP